MAERVRAEYGDVHAIICNAGALAASHGSDLADLARAWLQTYAVTRSVPCS